MITQLRSMLKSHVYKVFLWVFLAIMLFGGLSFDYSHNKPWVIKVYNKKITDLEFHQSVATAQRQYDYLKAQGISWPRTETIEKEVLRNLIGNALLANVGHELNLAIPSILLQEQLHNQLANLPAYFFDTNGQLIIEMLEKVIAPKKFDSLLADMENEIQADLLYNIISIGSYIPQFQVTMQCNEEFADKKYSILTFSLAKALTKVQEKKVADETLERFYKKSEHGDMYKTVEKRAGQLWKFRAQDYGLTVSKADALAYYEQQKHTEFLESPAQVQVYRIFFGQDNDEATDSKAQAHIIYDELQKDPASFATIAKKIAAAKLSHQGCEKTEFFEKNSTKYDKILVETAFEELAQDGDISKVIKTDKGYEVIQRIGRKAAKYKPFAQVQSYIDAKLLEEKFAKRFQQDAQRVLGNIGYNKEALSSFIEKKHGRKESIDLDVKKPGLIMMQLFQTEQGQFTVFMSDKEGILLECTHVDKKALKPFTQIKAEVSAHYYAKLAEQELRDVALQALKDLGSMNINAVAKKYEAHLETVHAEYKNGMMNIPAILRKPEIAQKIKNLQFVGAAIDVVTPHESYVIVLDKLLSVHEKVLEEKKQTIETSLAYKSKYKDRDSFIASLYRHAKLIDNQIEIKEQLLKDTKDISL